LHKAFSDAGIVAISVALLQGLEVLDVERLFDKILKPALGCTEPAAIALAVAAAAQAALGWTPENKDAKLAEIDLDRVESIRVSISRNLFKNAFSVAIPNTGGRKGITLSSALGVFCNPRMGLELFSRVDDRAIRAAKQLISAGAVKVRVAKKNNLAVYVRAAVALKTVAGPATGDCVIRHEHANIVALRRNGAKTFSCRQLGSAGASIVDQLKQMDIEHLLGIIEKLPEIVLAKIRETVEMNTNACAIGLTRPFGLVAGHYRANGAQAEDICSLISRTCAAGSDARMSGYPVQVMSCAGSGNQGIIATVPVVMYARHHGIDETRMLRAVALSSLITMYFTQHVGYLSALCGVAVKAGIGASCGIVYAEGGGRDEMGRAIKVMAASLTGMICDGAKTGCALKVGIAVDMAVRAAMLAMNKINIDDDNGIVGATAEETARNLSTLSRSMEVVDREILKIMQHKMIAGR
jgi:L-cysteine desulfidase